MTEIPSVLLAGGLARRSGGDKPMRIIAGKTILERVIAHRLGSKTEAARHERHVGSAPDSGHR
jgi:molybdopterin-guanine dinucleotide biosynthesis protein A